jgi:membrane associated rhomboid family serine protease
VFVPLHDANPLKSIPFQYVTVTIIALNVIAYIFIGTELIPQLHDQEADFAFIPAEFLDGARLPSEQVRWLENALPVPEQFTVISYMFLHGGILHLIGNMLFLWVFGDNVEDAMGHLRFLMFYMMCGIFAALAHAAAQPASGVPLVGASGAVAGIVAAYLMLHPKVKIWVLVLFRIPLRVNAAWALGFWVALQFFNVIAAGQDNVAWWAHVGGLVAGAVLILFMRRPGVVLFDRTRGGA